MAGKSATLQIKIVSDASQAGKGFDEAAAKTEKFQRGLDRASVAAAGALAGIGGLAKAAFDSASALQQSTGAVEAVFGKQADAVNKLAADAAGSAGLAAAEYGQFASVIGSQLKNMGIAADQVAPRTDALIRQGADLAAQFGGSTADAVEALSSLLRGERDPIERYGVSINQAAVNARVAALGLDTSTDAAKKNAETMATLSLLSEQTASAQGAFAREADTAAGAQQRASAQWENAKAALGEGLLPVVSAAATALQGFGEWAQNNTGTVQALTVGVGALAAAVLVVNGAVSTYKAIMAVATAVQVAFNIAMSLNPVMIIVLSVIALIAAIVLCYQKFEWFRNLVNNIASAIGQFIKQFISDPLGTVKMMISGVADGFQRGMALAGQAIDWVKSKIDALIGKLRNVPVVGSLIDMFSAPAAAPVPGMAAGLYGAADGAPLYAATMTGSAGGAVGPGSLGGASTQPTTVVNVTVNGALDPVAVGRQISDLLRQYGSVTGRTRTVALSR